MQSIQARIRIYLTPSASLDLRSQRLFVIASTHIPFAILVNALQIPLFLWMRLPVLVVFINFSIFAWIIVLGLARRARFYWAWCILTTEMLLHAALCVRYAGWGFGFQYYLFTLAAVSFLLPSKRWLSLLSAGAAMMEFIVLSQWANQTPWPGSAELLYVFNAINIIAAFGLVIFGTINNQNIIDRTEQALAIEHAKTEALLINILPAAIATRLKQDSVTIADRFTCASILFADIVNFTPLSQRLSPPQVVELLDDLFSRFDVLVQKYHLEKIKTVGDAYMVAAGIPCQRDDHAEALAEFALDLKKCMESYNAETGRDLRLRIGINSGPVVAGVIGKLRFLYDLWGDCVNTASRMESHGVPNEIQVSEETHDLLSGKYDFEERGVIEVKGKGPMRTYFLRERILQT